MLDLRPVGYVIGLFIVVLAVAMGLAALVDVLSDARVWIPFATAAIISAAIGGGVIMICAAERKPGLSVQQTFLLTVSTWAVMPLVGALPLLLADANLSFTDAFFEAMSALTTTGATVFSGLEQTPAGTLFWRGLLQWLGGIGVIVMAIAILPELQVGGMQLFRSEAFDTFGKILPRAAEIARSISALYVGLTLACMLVYAACGMSGFDALIHAFTTIATGGLANYDSSFGHFNAPSIHYAATVFMILASLPFVRYVQMLGGSPGALFRDSQVRAFMRLLIIVVSVMAALRWWDGIDLEEAFRSALFNVVSIVTGTGYSSEDYGRWGPFAVITFMLLGLIGGCAGSTCCSVKIFRYQVLAAAIKTQVRQIHNPSGVFRPRYEGRPISDDVMSSVMAFFMVFFLTLGLLTLALSLIGLDFLTALSGAAAALTNVGPGLGSIIGPSGTFAPLPDGAKWVLIVGMLLGRLELMSVLVLMSPRFWQR